ncbi:MAG: hypothetical protein JJ992_04185 [Planctomycetes bacterium]|nr:hypothetical protein [Planctomycetota bacterium]
MPVIRRIFCFVALSLGFVGIVVCVAGLLGAWVIRSRVQQVVDNAFVAIDDSLHGVDVRIAQTQESVGAARVTSEGLEQTLKDWSKREVGERVRSRLELDEKAEQLSNRLRQADDWLEFSESSIRLAQQALELVESIGAPAKSQVAGRLMEELDSLRTQLTQTMDAVDRIAERTSELGDEKPRKEYLDQAVPLALKAIATFRSMESRLVDVRDRLSELQARTQELETRIHRWILIGTIGISLLIAWMAAGQYFLCCHGWKQLTSKSVTRVPETPATMKH